MNDVVELSVLGLSTIGPEEYHCVVVGCSQRATVLPIWVSGAQLRAVGDCLAREQRASARPCLAEVFLAGLTQAGQEVSEVSIVGESHGVFYADILMSGGGRVDARASDGLCVAAYADVPLTCVRKVIDAAGVVLSRADVAEWLGITIHDDDWDAALEIDSDVTWDDLDGGGTDLGPQPPSTT